MCSGASPHETRRSPGRVLTGPPGCLAKCLGWREPVLSQMGKGVCWGLLGKGEEASENSAAHALGVVDTEFLPCHVPEPWTVSPLSIWGVLWLGAHEETTALPYSLCSGPVGGLGSPSQAAYPPSCSGPSGLWFLHEQLL